MEVKVTIEIPKIAGKETGIDWVLDTLDDILQGKAPGSGDRGEKGPAVNDIYQIQADETEVADKCVKFKVTMDDTAYKDPEGKGREDTFTWRTIWCRVIIDKDPARAMTDYLTEWIANYRDEKGNLIVVPETPGDGIYY
jgi:hypothetical protein